MNKLIFNSFVVGWAAFSFTAFAGFHPLTPSQRESDLQNKLFLRKTINNELKQKEITTQPSSLPYKGMISMSKDEASFLINKIEIDFGSIHRYDSKLKHVANRYLNSQMGAKQIYSLLREANNCLANEGLVTSTVVLVPGNLRNGTLKLHVSWGYVQGWILDGNPVISRKNRVMLFQAIPNAQNKLLNLRDIDQALENLNNGGQSVRIDIIPSIKNGYSWLNVTRQKRSPIQISLSLDNSGDGNSIKSGAWRYSTNINVNNTLAGLDNFSLALNTHHISRDKGNADLYTGINYSLPFGYNMLSLQSSYMSYRKPLHGYYGDYLSKGSTFTAGGRLTRTIYRDQHNKVSLFTGLQYKKGVNYLDATKILVNSQPYSLMNIGGQYVSTIAGGNFYSDITFNHGLSLFGGENAAINKNDGKTTDARFIGANASWNKTFGNFNYSLTMGGQWTPDTLFNDYRLAVGDDYTVRGFKGDPFLSDSGLWLNNTFNLPSSHSQQAILTPFLGIDTAFLHDTLGKNSTLTGGALGINLQWRNVESTISVGLPIHYSNAPKIDPWITSLNTRFSI